MLTARIHEDRPLLPITVGWKQNVQDLIVLVDTGFTGELKVTPQFAKELGIETTDVRTINMADGRSLACPLGLAYVSLEKVQKEVSVLIVEGMPVIGVRLLRELDYILKADFPSNEFTLQKKNDISFEEEG
jgi:clan AA aspartic protease